MNDPEVSDKWQFLNQTAFPIVVAGWFMLRLEKRLEKVFRILFRLEAQADMADKENEDDES